jgi:hypothetical protein
MKMMRRAVVSLAIGVLTLAAMQAPAAAEPNEVGLYSADVTMTLRGTNGATAPGWRCAREYPSERWVWVPFGGQDVTYRSWTCRSPRTGSEVRVGLQGLLAYHGPGTQISVHWLLFLEQDGYRCNTAGIYSNLSGRRVDNLVGFTSGIRLSGHVEGEPGVSGFDPNSQCATPAGNTWADVSFNEGLGAR